MYLWYYHNVRYTSIYWSDKDGSGAVLVLRQHQHDRTRSMVTKSPK